VGELRIVWLSNELPRCGTLTEMWGKAAVFDVAADEFEDYEQEWGDNENALASFDPADLSVFSLASDGGPYNYESYEHVRSMDIQLSSTTAGDPIDIDSSHGVRVAFAGTLNGDLRLQARSTTGGTWLELETITSVPVDVDVDSGYKQLRIYTQTYTSGSPTAKLKWRPMATL
jgi:hypothetical protein